MTRPTVFEFPKQPGEIIRYPGFDFGPQMAPGESFVLAGVTVTFKNIITGADSTSAMLVAASVVVAGTVVGFDVKDGADADFHQATIKVVTNLFREYHAEIIFEVRERATVLADAFRLIGTDAIMEYLRAPETDYGRVDRLNMAVTKRFESLTRAFLTLRAAPTILTFDGQNSELLDVGGRIISISEVKVAGTVLVVNKDYTVLAERGQIYRHGGWPEADTISGLPLQTVQITGSFGYVTAPEDLRDAFLMVCKSGYVAQNDGAGDLISEHIGDYSYTRQAGPRDLASGLPQEIMDVVLNYRRWGV